MTALGRGAHNAFASLRVSFRVNSTTSLETRSEVFLCLDFVSDRQGKATRNEDKPDLELCYTEG